ncbi:glycosyltransferase [Ekhidna sp.]
MKHGIVIPCYNQADRLDSNQFINLIKRKETYEFCFVNYGSTDKTLEALNFIRRSANTPNIYIYDLPENCGRAEAIRKGSQFLEKHTTLESIGFLDANCPSALEE